MKVEEVPTSAADRCAEEAALVSRFQQGCPQAAEVLFQQLSAPVRATLRRLLGWPTGQQSEMEDLLQNVFLAAWEHRRSFRGNSSLKTWITRIAINECRRAQRRRWLWRKWWRYTTALMSDSLAEAEDSLTKQETAQVVRRAVQKLKTHEREVVVLYYLEEMTAGEIAEALGLKRGTVEVRLSRARRRLAGSLGELS
jgi:RNA polymerase sigma-70 factor (ECF subfamily)